MLQRAAWGRQLPDDRSRSRHARHLDLIPAGALSSAAKEGVRVGYRSRQATLAHPAA